MQDFQRNDLTSAHTNRLFRALTGEEKRTFRLWKYAVFAFYGFVFISGTALVHVQSQRGTTSVASVQCRSVDHSTVCGSKHGRD